jgi:hypothetical protein
MLVVSELWRGKIQTEKMFLKKLIFQFFWSYRSDFQGCQETGKGCHIFQTKPTKVSNENGI